MNKRIVITGANGMLGKLCVEHFKEVEGVEVIPLTRKQMDLTKDSSIRKILDDIDFFDIIINTAAMTNVDGCEDDSDTAEQVNGYAVGMIGHEAAERGAQVIHISTDYVFDGEKQQPYTEEDEPNPIGVYGDSKHTGELELFDSFPDHLVARVSWLFGPGKQGFPEWVIRQAMEKEDLSIVSDKTGTPAYALDVVEALEFFVASEDPIGGIVHLTNSGSCTWQEWAQHCIDCAVEAGVPIKAKKIGALAMDDLAKLAGWKAKRPRYTTMATDHYTELTGKQMRPWQEGVAEYVSAQLAPALLAES